MPARKPSKNKPARGVERSIMAKRIMTFSPMVEGDPFVASIEGFPSFVFFAGSPMAAHKKAEDFRREQYERVLGTLALAEADEKLNGGDNAAQ